MRDGLAPGRRPRGGASGGRRFSWGQRLPELRGGEAEGTEGTEEEHTEERRNKTNGVGFCAAHMSPMFACALVSGRAAARSR